MKRLDPDTTTDLYAEYARPRVAKLLKFLKLDVVYTRGLGDKLEYTENKKSHSVVDLLGGFGSTLLGHNHPEIVRALERNLDENVPVHAQASVRAGAALVALELNVLMNEQGKDPRKFVATLCNSGTEAVEAGIKHALMEWQNRKQALLEKLEVERAKTFETWEKQDPKRRESLEAAIEELSQLNPLWVAVDGSFHGKTAGSVSVSTNPDLKGMYPTGLLANAVFLRRENDEEEVRAKAKQAWFKRPGICEFSRLAGIIFEAVQGEGGIQCLTPEFAGTLERLAKEHGTPLIADEIQCGLFRTGTFLASHSLGIKPDYVLLGKSLGGGVTKVSTLLVDSKRYQDKFGFIHTSTFAEDELSSTAALQTLKILRRDHQKIQKSALVFEKRVREQVAKIQVKYPGALNDVRGKGFLLGVEFNFSPTSGIPVLLNTLYQAGFATYVFTSYLLHRHDVRVGVTLSKPDTLRIEPSCFIEKASIDQFLKGLEELCALLSERNLVKITQHFWRKEFTDRELGMVSFPGYPAVRRSASVRRVGFLSHLINDTHAKLMDPLLRAIGEEGRERFVSKISEIAGPFIYHEQILEAPGGRKIHLHCYAVFSPSSYFEKSHREGNGLAMRQVQQLADRCRADQMDFIGLGQYTSIVSRNGLLLRKLGIPITTGNGLTAGFAYRGILKALADTGRSLEELKVGVVGAGGNICSVVTQLLADHAKELGLIFREGTHKDPKAQAIVKGVVENSKIKEKHITVADRMNSLLDCDVVLLGTSSAKNLLFPQHLKKDAIVMDVSVPSNIDPSVFTDRNDVKCYQGARATLPMGQILRSDWIPVPKGETYACMAETLAAGFLGLKENLSFGPLSKEGVLKTLDMARRTGIEMGSLKRTTHNDRTL